MQHIKDMLLGLCIIALVIFVVGIIILLFLNQTFRIVLVSFIGIVFMLFMSYLIGGAIRETREAQNNPRGIK